MQNIILGTGSVNCVPCMCANLVCSSCMLAKPIYINCGAAAYRRQPCKQWSGRAAAALPVRRHILLAQHRHALAVAAATVPLGAGVVVDAAARKSHWSSSIPWRGGRRTARPCCCVSAAQSGDVVTQASAHHSGTIKRNG